ncbi:MAG: (5-formylfuran-3-yl)methyl phosphate synthase [Methyloceanibacter sp.]|uniref:(5-formylfuran-3-yl)methyl phosphate synthase n=1 Tax=Methyloceanibacter sp. TaxID=1965321 RepID=UPI003D6D05CD
MTLFLASVRNRAEAELVLGAGADIVDLKDPGQGALGAVDRATLEACIVEISARAAVSATVGDLPMEPHRVEQAVTATAASGVDYVKLGVWPDGDPQPCLESLRAAQLRARLVLVFFADAMPSFDALRLARRAGAHGVMLDTASKQSGSLLDHMTIGDVEGFVQAAHREGLIAGVAGSLRAAQVPALLPLAPDLIGFRGALCHDGLRNGRLDPIACGRIRALIPVAAPWPERQMPESQAPALC